MTSRTARLASATLLCCMMACSGPRNVESDDVTQPYAASGLFTGVPTGTEDPEQVFLAADTAFRNGRVVDAQRDFGTLYIVQPAYGNNVPQAALTETCRLLPNDCTLLFDRLHFIRDAWYGAFGPMSGWPWQQTQDFNTVLSCYEAALRGDWSAAVSLGAPIAQNSPLPGFRDYAARCSGPAQVQLESASRQQLIDQAFVAWDQSHDCMDTNRRALLDAYRAGDWETFVGTHPAYVTCAAPLQQIIDDGVLVDHPILGNEHDVAFSNMSEIDAIVYDNQATITATQSALTTLQSNQDYQNGRIELDGLATEEQRLRGEMQPIEAALQALTGSARTPLEQRLSLLGQQLQMVLDRRAQVVRSLNRVRSGAGLSPLPTP